MKSTKEYYNLIVNNAPLSEREQFRNDVLQGLLSTKKHLNSKYFYDKRGDELFQQIMDSPEYYLTNCELDIFSNQAEHLANSIAGIDNTPFDLIELGAGDGTKSKYLLKELIRQKKDFNYLPIDISGNVLTQLESNLSHLDGLKMKCLEGDYLDTLAEATTLSSHRKVVLFLGANIGNMNLLEAMVFCQSVRNQLQSGDLFLIGFDLKKNPETILAAYNDQNGITRNFNLNLLERINRELDGDFNVSQFNHYPTYDPETGACKSFLISTIDQVAHIGEQAIHFKVGEWIFMEISQKYSIKDVQSLAAKSGFRIESNFTDQQQWFIDSIWKAI